MLQVARKVQPIDRGLGQQCAFGAGIDQQGHRFLVDLRLHEQHVAAHFERHFGERDQRAGAIGAPRTRIAGAGGHAEQCQQDQHRSRHGVAPTCTEARTAAPSASSTVSR